VNTRQAAPSHFERRKSATDFHGCHGGPERSRWTAGRKGRGTTDHTEGRVCFNPCDRCDPWWFFYLGLRCSRIPEGRDVALRRPPLSQLCSHHQENRSRLWLALPALSLVEGSNRRPAPTEPPSIWANCGDRSVSLQDFGNILNIAHSGSVNSGNDYSKEKRYIFFLCKMPCWDSAMLQRITCGF